MKVLFATTNPAKVKKYKKALEERGIELLTLKNLDINIKVEETGKNAIENAYIKAKTYYEVAHMPTIGMDNCLFVEELSEEEQPGTHVRRINGKELTDEEMKVMQALDTNKPSHNPEDSANETRLMGLKIHD